MASLPSKEEYIQARLIVERIQAERDWLSMSRTPDPPPPVDTKPKEITHKQAAELIGRSESYLRKLERRGLIQRLNKPGRTVYYKLRDVENLKRNLDA